jgi:hypothetical protein
MSISTNARLEEMPAGTLLPWLAGCPMPLFESVVLEVIKRFCRALGGLDFRVSRRVERGQRLVISRPDVMLRGFEKDDIHVLILAGEDESWTRAESGFWARVLSASEMPIILAASDALAEFALRNVRGNFALVLAPAETIAILEAPHGLVEFKRRLRRHFSATSLQPFDDHHPVSGPFFRGRARVLDKLLHQDRSNFALIGPSKMGKTSLVQHYLMLYRKSGKAGRKPFFKSMMQVGESNLALVRAIRMMLDPGWNAHYDEAALFPQFMRKFVSRQQTMPELILDEVDAHVHLPAIRALVDLSRENVLRLILIGRWRLCRICLHSHDDNILRLQGMRMEPLGVEEAEELIARPLADLGIDLSGVRHELRNAVNQCGRVPGHVHEFGQYLVESVQARGGTEASPEDLRQALGRVVQSARVQGLIHDLSSPIARIAALLVILRAKRGIRIDPLWLQARLRELQIVVEVDAAWEICDELVIHHLLGCPEDDDYRVGRWDFVAEGQRRRGYFEAMFAEHLKKARTGGAGAI